MKILLRGLLISLAVLALATQAARFAADGPADEPDLTARLAALALQPAASTRPDTFAATAPGCQEPVVLARVSFDGSGHDAERTLLALPATPRFVYLGFVGEHASTARMLGRWAAATLLHVTGLRRRAVPRDLVLVMLPSACPRLAQLDWSRLSPWS